MYFRDQGDSLTKAIMVNTQQPTESERPRQEGIQTGGGSPAQDVCDDEESVY